MRLFSLLVLFLVLSLWFPIPVHAIVVLPAVILIPIVKIVAALIGGVSVPALGLAHVWSKLFNTRLSVAVSVVLLMTVIIAIGVGFFLKISTPERPLF